MKKFVIIFIVMLAVCALSVTFLFLNNSGDVKPGMVLLISCISGAVAAIGAAIGIVYSYKRKSRSSQYPLDRYASLNLTKRMDIFLRRHVTRTKISSSNGKK